MVGFERLTFLPGLLCDGRIFSPQQARFDGALVIDGFGARRSIEEMARHVIDVAPPRMALLGHSMGARVALEVYRAVPERVERLALVSTGIHGVQPGEAAKRHALLELGRSAGMAALVDRWLPPMVASGRVTDQAFMTPLRTMAIDQGVPVFDAQIQALLARPEVESLLPTIHCPVLVAVGSDDVWSPPTQHRDIAGKISGSTLRIVAGAGHMLPMEAGDALNLAIEEWLALPM
ncbi:alpha/beta hydrolase [Sphingobium sp.]|uniref:alpha/beta fold hydrolase n=1 Tax=Sphingobium sp. TaxID=1912891 RepID=UPI001A35EC09|nr:alpha/beta hydrolase [Sphingobium sp.]MBJ7375673.1 alpha/beta fold hydrolase [Sphingobium sp.]